MAQCACVLQMAGSSWTVSRPIGIFDKGGAALALLYRLAGGRNPLHSDLAGNFPRPILHGVCSYGNGRRAPLHTVRGADPARFLSTKGRFTRPVIPGDKLTISIWPTEKPRRSNHEQRYAGPRPGPPARVSRPTLTTNTGKRDSTWASSTDG
ncbi:hypothetical protein F8568_043130 [Actinomadura sp. LD22]|uniref:MaoC-like domain-containing protein n=1 Tax=Actinomadura physcomitrii TaxID=2650748 RepID=A0A6I4MUN3_9ACTN|nr:MaoC/PaaZ C-terminal domain-containing protein [Actinomadura physcomitrii]MWA07021.1 hypothetical protein [Actinomadura physcomitrii]